MSFGDETADEVHFRGVLQTDMRFQSEIGLLFMSEDGLKSTKLVAAFDDDSEEGDRLI